MSGVAKIDFVGVEIDPLGAKAPGEITANAGRNDFDDAEKEQSAETDGGGGRASIREWRKR